MQCSHCAYPNANWSRRCGRCGRGLHSFWTHVAVWGGGMVLLVILALVLAGSR